MGFSEMEFISKVNSKSPFPNSFMCASESVRFHAWVTTGAMWTLWLRELCSAFIPQGTPNTRQLFVADFYWSFGGVAEGIHCIEQKIISNEKSDIKSLEIYFSFLAMENASWLCGCLSSRLSHSGSCMFPTLCPWAPDNSLSRLQQEVQNSAFSAHEYPRLYGAHLYPS